MRSSFSYSYLECKDAAYAKREDHQGQQHRGPVAQIRQGLHQGNASHLPVIAQHSRDEQQPGIEGQQVGICQNPERQRNRMKKVSEKIRKERYNLGPHS